MEINCLRTILFKENKLIMRYFIWIGSFLLLTMDTLSQGWNNNSIKHKQKKRCSGASLFYKYRNSFTLPVVALAALCAGSFRRVVPYGKQMKQ